MHHCLASTSKPSLVASSIWALKCLSLSSLFDECIHKREGFGLSGLSFKQHLT